MKTATDKEKNWVSTDKSTVNLLRFIVLHQWYINSFNLLKRPLAVLVRVDMLGVWLSSLRVGLMLFPELDHSL